MSGVLDSQTLIPVIAETKKNFGIKRTIVVADKGFNTANNIAFNTIAGNGYVFSQSVRGANKDLKNFVLDESGYSALNDGFNKSRLYTREISVTNKEGKKTKVSMEEKQVAIYSAKYDAKAKRDRAFSLSFVGLQTGKVMAQKLCFEVQQLQLKLVVVDQMTISLR